jgi:hypothetical protein
MKSQASGSPAGVPRSADALLRDASDLWVQERRIYEVDFIYAFVCETGEKQTRCKVSADHPLHV